MAGRPRLYADMACEACSKPFRPRKRRGRLTRFCSTRCAAIVHSSEVISAARALWDAEKSASAIGREMGLTKDQIIGIAHRNDFPSRPSPLCKRCSNLMDNPLFGVTHGLEVVQSGVDVAIVFCFQAQADSDAFYAWLARQSLTGQTVPIDFSCVEPK